MKLWIEKFSKDDGGATAIEYAVLASFIGMAIIVAVKGIGMSLTTTFTSVQTQLK